MGKRCCSKGRRVWAVMGGLWVLLLLSIVWYLYTAYKAKHSARRSYGAAVSEGFTLLQRGDHAALLKARDSFLKALRYSQLELRVWGALALIEARRELFYGERSTSFSLYRDGGSALLLEQGALGQTPQGLALRQEALLTYKFAHTKKETGYKQLYFEIRREWGFYPDNPGLSSLYALSSSTLGIPAVGLPLGEAKGVYQLYVRGLTLLDSGDERGAQVEFQTALSQNPEYHLAFLSLATLKGAPFRRANASRITRLAASDVPGIRDFALWVRSMDDAKMPPPEPTLALPRHLLRRALSAALKRGEAKRSQELWELLKLKESTKTASGRVVQANLLFVEGHPKKAWNTIQHLPRAQRKNHGVKFLWFAGDYAAAKREARGLPKSDHWYRLANGLCGSKAGTGIHRLAHLWRASDRGALTLQAVDSLEVEHQGRRYAQLLQAKVAASQAKKEGYGWEESQLLCKKALTLLKGPLGATIWGKRIRAAALTCLGKLSQALSIVESLCQGEGRTAGAVCSAPGADTADREQLLALLLSWESAEKDLELAHSKARHLISRVSHTMDSQLYYEARLALLKITLMPGSTQRILKRVLQLVRPEGRYTGRTLRAVAPLYALLGQSVKTLEIWRKYYGNHPLSSAHLAQFLVEVGSPREALQIAKATCSSRRCATRTLRILRRAEGLAKLALKQDALPLFREQYNDNKSPQSAVELLRALLLPPPKNRKERCQEARALLLTLKTLPAQASQLLAPLVSCRHEIEWGQVMKWAQGLPPGARHQIEGLLQKINPAQGKPGSDRGTPALLTGTKGASTR